MDGRIGIKGGVPQSPQIPNVGEGRWYVSDMGRTYGPLSWYLVQELSDSARVSPWAQIREESWHQWVPITMYFRVKTQRELEADALKPNVYDAIFWIAVFIFVFGVVMSISIFVLGVFLMFLSLPLEVLAIYLETKDNKKIVTRTLGNAIAILWMVVQFFLTMFIIYILVQ
jgi:hypothetical protein